MNDRFKFRIFIPDKKNSKNSLTGMFKVHSLHTGTNKTIISSLYGNCSIKLENNILMQSTGLKDKNGKLIFEGDVVKFKKIYKCACFTQEEEVLFKVKWEGYGFYLSQIKVIKGSVSYITGRRLTIILEKDTYTEHQTDISLEVIGNIYENKELLNE